MLNHANGETATLLPAEARRRALRGLRIRFAASLTLLGVLIAAAAAIIGTIYTPGVNEDPVRLTGASALYTAAGAGIGSLLLLLPVVYWIGGYADEARPLPLWLGIGLAFGVISTFLTGASLPFTLAFTYYFQGAISFGGLLNQLIDSCFRAPLASFTYGVLGLFTALLIGVIYGVVGWIIDMLNRMAHPNAQPDPIMYAIGGWIPVSSRWAAAIAPRASVIGPWALAIGIGLAIYIFAATGPVDLLEKLG